MGLLLGLAGCESDPKPKRAASGYVVMDPRANVPVYLHDTIFHLADVLNKDPYPVSGYGLVVGLPGTGGNIGVPATVREYMLDEMFRHGVGVVSGDERNARVKPEMMLEDLGSSLVTVIGYIPPGARKGQPIDLRVEALPDTTTTSLARGRLWRTNLRINGANPMNPRGNVNIYAFGQGNVFVNPAHAIATTQASGTVRASLRSGTVLGGGAVLEDRTLMLRLRQPQLSLARAMQERVRLAFPKTDDDPALKAQARDEGIVDLIVPLSFNGDWEHYIEVVNHLFLDATTGFASAKAQQLVVAAERPDAPLMNISYAWEGLGKPALDYIPKLYAHRSPDVSFAAVRAGACLGDYAAQEAVLAIAKNAKHPFQLNAVRLLGALAFTPRTQTMLAQLLDSDNTLVRIEAYRILTARQDQTRVQSQVVANSFILDLVPSSGPPLVYASRLGTPRIAIFGRSTALNVPIMFSAFNSRLTISSDEGNHSRVTVAYSGTNTRKLAVAELKSPDVRELVFRLGGGVAAEDEEAALRFSYADVVGVLQAMSDRRDMSAAFVMQDLPRVRDTINDAKVIPDKGTPPAATADEPRVNAAAELGARPR